MSKFKSVVAVVAAALAVSLATAAIAVSLAAGYDATPPAAPVAPAAPVTAPAEVEADAPARTVSQANAVRAAELYLEFMPFSREGLIDQLVFEGYSVADANYAADAVGL